MWNPKTTFHSNDSVRLSTKSFLVLIFLTGLLDPKAVSAKTSRRYSIRHVLTDVGSCVVTQTRRILNLNNIFGSVTSVPAYDRIMSQPVFAVTTPWGSPYLLFDKKHRTESSLEFDDSEDNTPSQPVSSQIALYFLDEHDAMQLRDEMLQMDQMKGADMRITAFSLGKALRQASNLHHGLLTGQPIKDLTGKIPSPQEGGSLRYKIVPPRRELFYAARCSNTKSVGLIQHPIQEARLMLSSFSDIGDILLRRRVGVERQPKNTNISKNETIGKSAPSRNDYRHMIGFVGIPVFHCPELRSHNALKGMIRFDRSKKIPLFFSYEDLIDCWSSTRRKVNANPKNEPMPEDPPQVEVYNLMDVVTSIDQEQWRLEHSRGLKRKYMLQKMNIFKGSLKKNKDLDILSTPSELQNIIFIPNTKSVQQKELISRMGSKKVKFLRPMKPWGRDAM